MLYANGYTHRATCIVDRTQCGSSGAVPGAVARYPGSPDLRTTANGGHSLSSGRDVVFAADGPGLVPLPFEYVAGSYNPTTGVGEWHVQLGASGSSQASSLVDAVYYCFTGKAGVATDLSTPDATMWPGYGAVYHFGGGADDDADLPTMLTRLLMDSSGNGKNIGNPTGNLGHTTGIAAPGAWGSLMTFSLATLGYGRGYGVVPAPGLTMPFTISCWARDPFGPAGNNGTIWAANINVGGDTPEGFLVATGNAYAFNNQSGFVIAGAAPIGTHLSGWNYYGATFRSTSYRTLRLNDNPPGVDTTLIPAPRQALDALALGVWLQPGVQAAWEVDGVFDEYRVSTGERSDDFALVEYRAFGFPTTFHKALGPFVTPDDSGATRMPRGIYVFRGAVSANGAIVTPAADERIYLRWITASVGTLAASGRLALTDGVGGAVIARLPMATADASIQLFYDTGARQWEGNPLTPGTALAATISGGSADLEVAYEIR